MAAVLIDDRLLIEELLEGLKGVRSSHQLHSTSLWYYRACRAAVARGGGRLSGPFERVSAGDQALAIGSLLQLRDDIALPEPRLVVPSMARVAVRHPKLNLLALEVVAAASVASATVWLSDQGAEGVLPSALDAESIRWRTIGLPE